MKNIIKIIIAIIVVASFAACDPQEEEVKDLGSVIPAKDINVLITHSAGNANLVTFKLENTECVGIFNCPDAGIHYTGMEFSKLIIFPGTYNMAVQVYNKAGVSDTLMVPIEIANMDLSILAGSAGDPNGKTWRINGSVAGHIGCGPEDATSNSWWNPAANSLTPALYDDDITFIQTASKFILNNKGASFMNESTGSLFPDGNTSDSFVTTNYSPATDATWSLEQKEGENWLVINKGFPAYAANPAAITSGRYKIVDITSTDMHIVYLPGGISWHYFLTSKAR